jgi:DNA polymerase III delta prime subunit
MSKKDEEIYTHLGPEAQTAINLPEKERFKYIRRPLWVGYTAAKKALKKLDVLFDHPKKERMPNLLLAGDTNNGKTTIITRFQQKHPGHTDEDTGRVIMPVFIVQVPSVPDELRFYNTILEKLFAPYKERERPDKKLFQVIRILERLQTKVMILDEIHHIIAGNLRKQKQFLNAIKYLSNELQIPLIGVGTGDAFNAIMTDPQVSNRFEPFILPRWKYDDDFLQLLASFEYLTPLKKPSWLAEDSQISEKILGLSEGTIGEIITILTEAAIVAIENKEERITIKILNELDYFSPSQRKKRRI